MSWAAALLAAAALAAGDVAALKASTAALVAAAPPLVQTDLDRPTVIWGTPATLSDGADAPEMAVIPAGEFTMGSPESQPGRRADEGPRRRVRIGYAFAVAKRPVTVREFGRFVMETKRDMKEQCQGFDYTGKWDYAGCNWSSPGFEQGKDNPVVAVSWQDAQAYVAWLSARTGRKYRLLSEAEYEYVNRAGGTSLYAWGDEMTAGCGGLANGADLDTKAVSRFSDWIVNDCHDGHPFTAPADELKPNAFGVYAMTGNTWSWTEDCWAPSYEGAPVDGSPRRAANCRTPVVRGGSWADRPNDLRAASRGRNLYYIRFAVNGFRVARDL
jgi:formylglycine-generating enzyme required for sulfatase activity